VVYLKGGERAKVQPPQNVHYLQTNKNKMTNSISTLAATGTKLDLVVADIQGQIKFTKLAPAKAKRSQLVFTSGYRSTGYRAAGVKIRGGNGNNCGSKVG